MKLVQKPEILRMRQRNRSLQNWLYAVNVAQSKRKEDLEKLWKLMKPLRTYGFSCPSVIHPESSNPISPPSQLKPIDNTSRFQKQLREYFLTS